MKRSLHTLSELARSIGALTEYTGRAIAWLPFLLVIIVSYDVAMRYLFHRGSVALQELEWHLFAVLFLVGSAHTLKHDAHVRVDIIYYKLSPHARAWIDLIGNALFLLPFCLVVVASSWPFVHNAYVYGEASPDPGGLPYRFLIKSAIPLGFVLLALQGAAGAIRSVLTIVERSVVRKSEREV